MIHVLDTFSGIGGFSLGLEWAGGFETVGFCEIDAYCVRVLQRHWPGVPVFGDIRTLTADNVVSRCGPVDLVCGGFPCQDISSAGRGAGLDGDRSGLWFEMLRLVRDLRPRWLLVENVPTLRTRGADTVCDGLEAAGYTVWPTVVGAWAVGAPHKRDRVWIVAADTERVRLRVSGHGEDADPARAVEGAASERERVRADAGAVRGAVAHADEPRLEGRDGAGMRERAGELAPRTRSTSVADAESTERDRIRTVTYRAPYRFTNGGRWLTEPDVGRVAHGVPARVDRLRGLGNAVVPQVVALFGEWIVMQDSRPAAARDTTMGEEE